jgi:2-phosphoglycerate kinase
LKTYVVNSSENTRIPFLRGILTRSLLDAGLTFKKAFEMATAIREGLNDTAEISVDELRERVSKRLEKVGNTTAQELYNAPLAAPPKILVSSLSASISAFSRGRHQRYLQSSGLSTEVAEQTTALIYDQLLVAGVSAISTCQLGFVTYQCLLEEIGGKAARQYLVWSEFQRSERPLLLLIGGTVGSGKSSIATEIAHRFEVVRTQSTDMLREVMRMMIPERLLPVLHTSSFDAWSTLPVTEGQDRDRELMIAEGYVAQAELLSVPCEAVLQRAVRESVPLILEGVHVQPDLLNHVPADSDAIKVYVTMAVLKRKELKARLRGRGSEAPKRRAKRYLNKIDSIWSLQSFLLSEADRCDVPIIRNDDKERAIQQVINTVNAELKRNFSGSPLQVFGTVVDDLSAQAERWKEMIVLLSAPETPSA